LRWHTVEPWHAFVIAIDACRPVEDRPDNFQSVVDRCGAYAYGQPVRHERSERTVVDQPRFERSDVGK
jgi:hypothetical protein